ncbi:prolyl oligopeptidase family protein [Dyadobacter sp. CY323]|uniref:prolyl oligopeptidase family serine peptidase n=1 Tax=Dyadobacter sp. CY323 TaxID=2907302 RepID=UPI001F33CC26|nr:prolyl oligopeptidase family serine peptidase [Dyadobacter sp. CY323]MCE6990945.1 prolyl oligopeptidase family serine peptidase [Dyadobacter sp. CY323]
MSVIAATVISPDGFSQEISYPQTKKIDHVDEYHGVKVADPYRWLEDDRSEETAAWVKAENEVTFSYLNKIPFKEKIFNDLEKAYNYPKYSAPQKKGEYFYFYKNDGLQNQAVLYRQKGLKGNPEVVLDPNKLSADGTTRLTVFNLSKDGSHAVLGFSQGGSDWQEYNVMDMKTLKMLSDKVEWVKVSGASWQGNGFYYSRYPQPEGSALAAKNENHQVFFHEIGTEQKDDKLIFEDPANPQRFHTVGTTEDERYVVLTVSDRGKGKDGNGLWVMKKGGTRFSPIKEEITDFSFGIIDNIGDDFLIETNENAPNSKVLLYTSKSKSWKTILAEKSEPLQGAGTAGGKLFVSYLKDVTTRVNVFDLTGKLENEVILPGLGSASGFGGEKEDTFVFYTYTSFNYPPTIFRYDIASKKSEVFRAPEVSFKPDDYETKQVFYPSKDGTKIPAFITYKKGIKLDGSNPTILYGYGGFNISLPPAFSSIRVPFFDQGGIYVQANLRGGSEYGEKWHEQGMKLKKQNVFDDFIAAAEYLIKEKYTAPEKLAIQGGSNGGLLVGAVMNQRPELFKVAFPAVGVMDMLRFHKFTIGWNWIADYGSSDNADEFAVLKGYSPLHNIKEGGKYPATMITTADHDDRVVPAHSFKYAAELQAKAGASSTNPLLIRIDTNSGHGASNTKKALETQSDIYAFLFKNMGLVWK